MKSVTLSDEDWTSIIETIIYDIDAVGSNWGLKMQRIIDNVKEQLSK